MFKLIAKWLSVLLAVMVIAYALSGCQREEVEKITFKDDNEVHDIEGVFLSQFDPTHIDIQINEKRKMFLVPNELLPVLETLKANDRIKIKYQKNEQSDLVIKEIKKKDKGQVVVPVVEPPKEEPVKEELQDEEVKLDNGVMLTLNQNFEYANGVIRSKNNGNYNVTIENLENTSDIKSLRWEAAGTLKEKGTLKELKGSNIPNEQFQNSEFVFTSLNSEPKMTIAVKNFNGTYLRFIISVPNGEDETELWSMLESVYVN